MAEKAARKSGPMEAVVVAHFERDGVQYPAVMIKGDAPRKGATLRVRLPNGIVYAAKVHDATEADGKTMVETTGLVPA